MNLYYLRSYEKWPFNNGRAIYSALTLVIQYTLPILIISVLHTRICHRLRTRHTALEAMASSQDSRKRSNETKASSLFITKQ